MGTEAQENKHPDDYPIFAQNLRTMYCSSCGNSISVCRNVHNLGRPAILFCYECGKYERYTEDKPKDVSKVDIEAMLKGQIGMEIEEE